MKRSFGQTTLLVSSLLIATGLLTGCPKKPASMAPESGPSTAATPTPSSGGSSTVGSGPGPSVGSGSGPGTSASSGTEGSGPVAAATGTTIPALPSPKEFIETSALRDIGFDFDKFDIRPGDARILEDNARWLRTNVDALLLIEGHCDERGTNEYNLALGERRANATRDYLVSLGVDTSRMTIISYGEERPVCTERTEGCWAQNRRAHFLVKQ